MGRSPIQCHVTHHLGESTSSHLPRTDKHNDCNPALRLRIERFKNGEQHGLPVANQTGKREHRQEERESGTATPLRYLRKTSQAIIGPVPTIHSMENTPEGRVMSFFEPCMARWAPLSGIRLPRYWVCTPSGWKRLPYTLYWLKKTLKDHKPSRIYNQCVIKPAFPELSPRSIR